MERDIKIVNLTPHTLHIETINDKIITIEPSGVVARVETSYREMDYHGGYRISIYERCYGAVMGIPEQQVDTIYVVSSIVQARCKDRRDIYCPGELIRDEQGHVVACRGLVWSK